MASHSGKCIICSHFNYQDASVTIFGFPSDKARMEKWRKALAGNYPFLSPSKRSFICALHFEPECITEAGELTEESVPSVWIEYPEEVKASPPSRVLAKGKKKVKKSKKSHKDDAEAPSSDDETKEETVMIVPDIMLPEDFEPHPNDETNDESPEGEKVKTKRLIRPRRPVNTTGKRKSIVLVVPKVPYDDQKGEKEESEEENDGDDEKEHPKPKKPKTPKKQVEEKKAPAPFEIHLSEPISKTRYAAECITCEKHMFDSTQIVMHIKDEHLQAPGSFQCRVCMEKFAFLFACQNHLVLHLDGHLV